jgi:hypothetical protein
MTLQVLLSLQYQDLQNIGVIIFQYMYMCPRKTIEIQMNFYPNPDEQQDMDDCDRM